MDKNRKKKAAGTKRTSIGLKPGTKRKLDQIRAPGQSYDGFITQMADLWEKVQQEEQ